MTYTKTEAGMEEIKTRALKLPAQMRNVLLMVDGKRSVTELENIVTTLGAPEGSLLELHEKGLIIDAELAAAIADAKAESELKHHPEQVVAEEARYTDVQQIMNDMVRSTMGLRGVFMTMKIERCMSLADLKKLYPDFETAIIKAAGKQVGETLCDKVRQLLFM